MEEMKQETPGVDVRSIIQDAIQEFIKIEQSKAEPAYKAELVEERKRREQLERRLGELEDENRKSRQIAEEAERNSQIRAELQRLGVAKLDLAFKAVRDDIYRSEDGRVVGRSGNGDVGLKDYLQQFVSENPELLPARISGGSGASAAAKTGAPGGSIDLDRIRPGMSAEDLERARQEVARAAAQAYRGK